jgi:hypothetical protein
MYQEILAMSQHLNQQDVPKNNTNFNTLRLSLN